jgi:hypothetical protein
MWTSHGLEGPRAPKPTSYLIVRGLDLNSPHGGSTLVVYLFERVESRAKNSKVAHEHTEHNCWCRLLEDCVIVQGVALPTLYWPSDKVSSQTPGRLRPGDLSLVVYNYCHIRRAAFSESTVVLSCTPSLCHTLKFSILGCE